MPGPQKENGYTPIANELLEAIYSANFNATQLKIVLMLMRYTYGFSRKEHGISLTFISKGTGISRRYVSTELKKLVTAGVIEVTREHTDTEARMLMLNKHYKEWEMANHKEQQVNNSSTGEAEQDTTGDELITRGVEELIIQDKQNIKQNIKQVHEHFEYLWQKYPRKKGKGSVSDTQKKKLHRIGKEHMERCISRFIKDMENEGRPIDKYLYGGTFFNSGYIDYLDDNYQPPADNKKREVTLER